MSWDILDFDKFQAWRVSNVVIHKFIVRLETCSYFALTGGLQNEYTTKLSLTFPFLFKDLAVTLVFLYRKITFLHSESLWILRFFFRVRVENRFQIFT